MDPNRLKGKNILITGAARGMGAANAVAFAAQGANVCLGDLDEGRGVGALLAGLSDDEYRALVQSLRGAVQGGES